MPQSAANEVEHIQYDDEIEEPKTSRNMEYQMPRHPSTTQAKKRTKIEDNFENFDSDSSNEVKRGEIHENQYMPYRIQQ